MCSNVTLLYVILVLRILLVFVLPIVTLILRKRKIAKKLLITNIVLLSFFLICNVFEINKCIYNSTFYSIKNIKESNFKNEYDTLHPNTNYADNTSDITPNKNYKTTNNTSLYYFNQNKPYTSNIYYECNNNKIYMNSFGSAITALSTVMSTLYDNNINPVQLFEIYKENNNDLCINKMELVEIYNVIIQVYGGITIEEISSNEVYAGLRNGGYVIVELSATEDSKLTCDNGYIIIYNITKDDKYMIADPSLSDNSYVCPYSSAAYGNIISNSNMEKSWTIEEIDNEAVRYYLIRKG